MKRVLLAVLLICSFYGVVSAQTTGSFQLNVTFPQTDYNVNRTLYYFVPTDYDANESYKLVVGFRGGPHSNAGQFRNQLRFLSDSIGAIILCPENAPHFNNQEGLVKKLFNYSVDTTMSMYNIDSEFIYLTGLSYGGRHSVIVSMDTDAGAIPSIRGVIPFAAGTASEQQPNYDSVSDFPPACICIGLNDSPNFINVSHALNQDIQSNNGISLLNEIPGVGHTVAFASYPEEMMECIQFIENQYSAIYDTRIEELNQVIIHPNPVSDYLEITYPENRVISDMYIATSSGKLIRALNNESTRIDISYLENGVYLLMVCDGIDLYSVKFIVQK